MTSFLDFAETLERAIELRDYFAAILREQRLTASHGVRMEPSLGGYRILLVTR
jgi:hypothetical protein